MVKGPGSAKAAVNTLFQEKLNVTTEVSDAFEIKLKTGKTKIIAKFDSYEDKIAVMKAKKSLPDGIFINDDLIAKDQFLQYKAREFVKSLGSGRKDVRIRTGTVLVDGTSYAWEESSQRFIERKN